MLAHGQELWIWPVDIRKGILIVVVGLGEGTAAVAAHVRSAPLDLAVCTFSGATAGCRRRLFLLHAQRELGLSSSITPSLRPSSGGLPPPILLFLPVLGRRGVEIHLSFC
ncbi:hypothetical protein PVAP13_3KG427100 [Panicum virgatum]|uniref:Uncharacterized protein n=1 Tax=Panicum virgatum TaxID=38727 RepID=A0A8T0V764_PANVG|nr:hypothetical protein PVAP13_3KG427100 [Panicum virgatum]